MGRWSHLDTDEERLPEGMVRVGYDADTQVYTYRDSDGSYWEGAPGVQYGKLHRVRSSTPPLPSVHIADDIRGDEQPYVLHDFYSSDADDSSDEKNYEYNDVDEKAEQNGILLPSPDKAILHPTASPHHHATGKGSKTLPNLPTGADPEDVDADTLSTATTVRVSAAPSIKSNATTITINHGTDTKTTPGLRRAGTLSRLARFLSSSVATSPSPPPSSSATGRLSRRATVHDSEARGARSNAATSAARANGRWPGSAGHRSPPSPLSSRAETGGVEGGPRRKRATTFEEILGEGYQ
ncbi:hypothetical protein P885DRAFT_73196 [Corynascus similis CBS 632.67]